MTETPMFQKDIQTTDILQDSREIQMAAIKEYRDTRVLPSINDPKIYSVRVRVSISSHFIFSHHCNFQLQFNSSVAKSSKLFSPSLTSISTMNAFARTTTVLITRRTFSPCSGQAKKASSISSHMMKPWFAMW